MSVNNQIIANLQPENSSDSLLRRLLSARKKIGFNLNNIEEHQVLLTECFASLGALAEFSQDKLSNPDKILLRQMDAHISRLLVDVNDFSFLLAKPWLVALFKSVFNTDLYYLLLGGEGKSSEMVLQLAATLKAVNALPATEIERLVNDSCIFGVNRYLNNWVNRQNPTSAFSKGLGTAVWLHQNKQAICLGFPMAEKSVEYLLARDDWSQGELVEVFYSLAYFINADVVPIKRASSALDALLNKILVIDLGSISAAQLSSYLYGLAVFARQPLLAEVKLTRAQSIALAESFLTIACSKVEAIDLSHAIQGMVYLLSSNKLVLDKADKRQLTLTLTQVLNQLNQQFSESVGYLKKSTEYQIINTFAVFGELAAAALLESIDLSWVEQGLAQLLSNSANNILPFSLVVLLKSLEQLGQAGLLKKSVELTPVIIQLLSALRNKAVDVKQLNMIPLQCLANQIETRNVAVSDLIKLLNTFADLTQAGLLLVPEDQLVNNIVAAIIVNESNISTLSQVLYQAGILLARSPGIDTAPDAIVSLLNKLERAQIKNAPDLANIFLAKVLLMDNETASEGQSAILTRLLALAPSSGDIVQILKALSLLAKAGTSLDFSTQELNQALAILVQSGNDDFAVAIYHLGLLVKPKAARALDVNLLNQGLAAYLPKSSSPEIALQLLQGLRLLLEAGFSPNIDKRHFSQIAAMANRGSAVKENINVLGTELNYLSNMELTDVVSLGVLFAPVIRKGINIKQDAKWINNILNSLSDKRTYSSSDINKIKREILKKLETINSPAVLATYIESMGLLVALNFPVGKIQPFFIPTLLRLQITSLPLVSIVQAFHGAALAANAGCLPLDKPEKEQIKSLCQRLESLVVESVSAEHLAKVIYSVGSFLRLGWLSLNSPQAGLIERLADRAAEIKCTKKDSAYILSGFAALTVIPKNLHSVKAVNQHLQNIFSNPYALTAVSVSSLADGLEAIPALQMQGYIFNIEAKEIERTLRTLCGGEASIGVALDRLRLLDNLVQAGLYQEDELNNSVAPIVKTLKSNFNAARKLIWVNHLQGFLRGDFCFVNIASAAPSIFLSAAQQIECLLDLNLVRSVSANVLDALLSKFIGDIAPKLSADKQALSHSALMIARLLELSGAEQVEPERLEKFYRTLSAIDKPSPTVRANVYLAQALLVSNGVGGNLEEAQLKADFIDILNFESATLLANDIAKLFYGLGLYARTDLLKSVDGQYIEQLAYAFWQDRENITPLDMDKLVSGLMLLAESGLNCQLSIDVSKNLSHEIFSRGYSVCLYPRQQGDLFFKVGHLAKIGMLQDVSGTSDILNIQNFIKTDLQLGLMIDVVIDVLIGLPHLIYNKKSGMMEFCKRHQSAFIQAVKKRKSLVERLALLSVLAEAEVIGLEDKVVIDEVVKRLNYVPRLPLDIRKVLQALAELTDLGLVQVKDLIILDDIKDNLNQISSQTAEAIIASYVSKALLKKLGSDCAVDADYIENTFADILKLNPSGKDLAGMLYALGIYAKLGLIRELNYDAAKQAVSLMLADSQDCPAYLKQSLDGLLLLEKSGFSLSEDNYLKLICKASTSISWNHFSFRLKLFESLTRLIKPGSVSKAVFKRLLRAGSFLANAKQLSLKEDGEFINSIVTIFGTYPKEILKINWFNKFFRVYKSHFLVALKGQNTPINNLISLSLLADRSLIDLQDKVVVNEIIEQLDIDLTSDSQPENIINAIKTLEQKKLISKQEKVVAIKEKHQEQPRPILTKSKPMVKKPKRNKDTVESMPKPPIHLLSIIKKIGKLKEQHNIKNLDINIKNTNSCINNLVFLAKQKIKINLDASESRFICKEILLNKSIQSIFVKIENFSQLSCLMQSSIVTDIAPDEVNTFLIEVINSNNLTDNEQANVVNHVFNILIISPKAFDTCYEFPGFYNHYKANFLEIFQSSALLDGCLAVFSSLDENKIINYQDKKIINDFLNERFNKLNSINELDLLLRQLAPYFISGLLEPFKQQAIKNYLLKALESKNFDAFNGLSDLLDLGVIKLVDSNSINLVLDSMLEKNQDISNTLRLITKWTHDGFFSGQIKPEIISNWLKPMSGNTLHDELRNINHVLSVIRPMFQVKILVDFNFDDISKFLLNINPSLIVEILSSVMYNLSLILYFQNENYSKSLLNCFLILRSKILFDVNFNQLSKRSAQQLVLANKIYKEFAGPEIIKQHLWCHIGINDKVKELYQQYRQAHPDSSTIHQQVFKKLKTKNKNLQFSKEAFCDGWFVDILVELSCSNRKLIIELDGPQHYEKDGSLRGKDKLRDKILVKAGYSIKRIKLNKTTGQEIIRVLKISQNLIHQYFDAKHVKTSLLTYEGQQRQQPCIFNAKYFPSMPSSSAAINHSNQRNAVSDTVDRQSATNKSNSSSVTQLSTQGLFKQASAIDANLVPDKRQKPTSNG